MRNDDIWTLIIVFVPLSLVSVGGGPSIFAGIQNQAVDVHHWVNAREFVDLFAIARAAPGPGLMLATLLGWKVAGWGGAIVATLALFLPSSLVCYGVSRMWNRYRGRDWHTALENGLAPIGVGLILAGVFAIFRIAGAGILSWAVAAASAAVLGWRPKLNPLVVLVAGSIIFAVIRAAIL
jgi:chromate transporter